MTNRNLSSLIDQLDRFLAEPDDQLLSRFIATRDEASFAAIVRRHGPMVLGVCRRLLRHHQDAEDCFQATFIIMARRASAVIKRTALASWLYSVACRTAKQARSVNARRQGLEIQVEEMPQSAVVDPELQDWRPLLDEELNRLPHKYKTVIILCDLEGRPRKDVALMLGIPEGTLSSRLTRARQLLAGRLAGRGVALSVSALAAALGCASASAAIPLALVNATTRVAVLAAAGQLAVNATKAAALTHEVMKAMFLTKLKAAVAVLVLAVVLGVTGVATQIASVPMAQAQPAVTDAKKATSEVEALRREIELLKLNLRVTLEKLDALEKRQGEKIGVAKAKIAEEEIERDAADLILRVEQMRRVEAERAAELKRRILEPKIVTPKPKSRTELATEIEAATKALREAKGQAEQEKAIKALDEAIRKLRSATPESSNPGKYKRVEQ